MLDILTQPWPWYVAGGIIGLMVPVLLLIGNKHFGISANLRHVCAACFPARIRFFQYDWKKEAWNLFFVAGIIAGAALSMAYLDSSSPSAIDPRLSAELATHGISSTSGLVPETIFSFEGLFTARGFIMLVAGGFLVGFGSRYAGGCTSGHAIMGLSNLQWPSLVATIMFMVGGLLMANFILPLILSL
jgi:uncharacterized membrane protein YedE/YeeE